MKTWHVLFIVLSLFLISSYVSAKELLSNDFENSIFQNPFEDAALKNNMIHNTGLTTSNFNLSAIEILSQVGINDTTGNTVTTSGRISSNRKHMELTPMWGYMFGGKFEDEENDETLQIADKSSFGFRFAYDYDSDSQIEFLYNHQETELTGGGLFPRDALFDLDVDYFQIGGSLFWDRGSTVEPYFTGTVGLTNFNPQAKGINSLTRFSMGFGGGIRYFPTKRIGLYTGARGFVTFMNSDIEVHSDSEDKYLIINADTIWQFQVVAGLIFVF